MASGIGDGLYVEIGTVGNTEDLEKFVKRVRNGAKQIEKFLETQEKGNKKLKDFANFLKTAANSIENSSIKSHNKLTNSVKRGVKSFIAFVGAITAAAYALNRLTNDLVRNNQAFLNLTRQSDIALSSFQKWDGIGKMFGIENAAGQLETLNEKLFELRLTGEGARGFQLAGINPIGQDAQGVLEQLRSRIQGMDNTTASYLLKQMGLDPRMITLLRMSRQEFEELGATIRKYQLTDKQRQQIEKMNIQLQIASQKLQYLKDRAILAIMPYWVKFVQSLARVAEGIARFVNWTTKAIKFIGSLKIGTISLSQAITTVLIPALLALGLIFKPLETLFLGLYLIIDDFIGFLQGKDSVLGLFMNFIDELNDKINFETPKWIQDLLAVLQNINDLKGLSNVAKNIATGQQNTVDLKQIPKAIVENPLTWLFQPNLSGLGMLSRQATKWLPKINEGIKENEALDKTSFLTPAMTQSIDNSNAISNANTTIAMTNYIETEQPAQSIDRELRFTMASYA